MSAPAEFMTPHDVLADGSKIEHAAFLLRDPPAPFEAADGYGRSRRATVIEWYEEATKVHVHARDPRHRGRRHPQRTDVRVELDGEVMVESSRPTAVFETTLPTRWYVPRDDVRMDLLEPSDNVTQCPFKGVAGFYSAGRWRSAPRCCLDLSRPDSGESPHRRTVAFFNERVDLIVDGERQRRPFTPWSLDVRA